MPAAAPPPFVPTHRDTQTELLVRIEPNRAGTAALAFLATGRPLTAVALPLPERFAPVAEGAGARPDYRAAVDAMQTVLAYLAAFPGTHASAVRIAARWGLSRWRFAAGARVQVVARGMMAAVEDVLAGDGGQGAYDLGEMSLPVGAVGEVIEVTGYGPDDPEQDGTLVVSFAWTEDDGARRRAVASFAGDSGFARWDGPIPGRGLAPVTKPARR